MVLGLKIKHSYFTLSSLNPIFDLLKNLITTGYFFEMN